MEDREMRMFEKATQTYFKEMWEFVWAIIGGVGVFVLVCGGIYFSQVAFAYWLGSSNEFVIAFCYAIAVVISALETSGVKLLGNKLRSADIKSANKLEHSVMFWFTLTLFVFDVVSNASGLYVTIEENLKTVSLMSWVFIVGMSCLLGGSELMVGWQLRSMAVSYTGFISAKKIYDKFQLKLEQEQLNFESDSLRPKEHNQSNRNKRKDYEDISDYATNK